MQLAVKAGSGQCAGIQMAQSFPVDVIISSGGSVGARINAT